MKGIDYFYLWLRNSAIRDFRDKTNNIILGMCFLWWVQYIPYFLLQIIAWLIIYYLVHMYGTMGETLYQLQFKEEILKKQSDICNTK